MAHLQSELRYDGITLALDRRTFEMRVERSCENCAYADLPTRFNRTWAEDSADRDRYEVCSAERSPLKDLVTQLCPSLGSHAARSVILRRVKSQMQLEGLSDDESSLDEDTKAHVTSVIRSQVDQFCQVGEAVCMDTRQVLVPKLVCCRPRRRQPEQ